MHTATLQDSGSGKAASIETGSRKAPLIGRMTVMMLSKMNAKVNNFIFIKTANTAQ